MYSRKSAKKAEGAKNYDFFLENSVDERVGYEGTQKKAKKWREMKRAMEWDKKGGDTKEKESKE